MQDECTVWDDAGQTRAMWVGKVGRLEHVMRGTSQSGFVQAGTKVLVAGTMKNELEQERELDNQFIVQDRQD